MGKSYFGTDGIRGIFGEYPLTTDAITAIGCGIGHSLAALAPLSASPKVVIGKDTRASCAIVEECLVKGLTAVGVSVLLAGVVPTPAVSLLTQTYGCLMGLMISASHNPPEYNGIKMFDERGHKISVAHEEQLCAAFDAALPHVSSIHENPSQVVTVPGADVYLDYISRQTRWTAKGLRVVLDCAHGAFSAIADRALRGFGAEIVARIGCSPDGYNSNLNSGAMHPDGLRAEVLANGADLGVSFDGDGDRVLLLSDKGDLIDGDQILACAIDHMCCGNWPRSSGIVGTILSNKGLEDYAREHQVLFERSRVGDRCVAEKMAANQWNSGGEPCGHIIFFDHLPSGDGLAAALMVSSALVHKATRASTLFPLFHAVPQVTQNVPLRAGCPIGEEDFLKAVEPLCTSIQAHGGRVVLRFSGTEPLLRVMVEHPCALTARSHLDHISHFIASYSDLVA